VGALAPAMGFHAECGQPPSHDYLSLSSCSWPNPVGSWGGVSCAFSNTLMCKVLMFLPGPSRM
jgi:hypothetical protein